MRLSVLTLRLAPSAEPARHMTMNFLPDDGLLVGTPKAQLETCEHPHAPYPTTCVGPVQTGELKPLKRVKPFYPRAQAPGLYGLFL